MEKHNVSVVRKESFVLMLQIEPKLNTRWGNDLAEAFRLLMFGAFCTCLAHFAEPVKHQKWKRQENIRENKVSAVVAAVVIHFVRHRRVEGFVHSVQPRL